MKNIDKIVISQNNYENIEKFGEQLAATYKSAFAGPPWLEVSKCVNIQCDVDFSSRDTGRDCDGCSECLTDAYDTQSLIENWTSIVKDEDGMIELTLRDEQPNLATIVRPTNPQELIRRKYDDIPRMGEWIDAMMPNKFVWIEDSFANRSIVEKGNLSERGATLGRIAIVYSGLTIVTRTLNPAIISATARDAGERSTLYQGSKNTGFDGRYDISMGGKIPDRRTLIVIGEDVKV